MNLLQPDEIRQLTEIGFLAAARGQCLAKRIGEILAVGRLVVKDRDFLVAEAGDEIRRDFRLAIVAPACPENRIKTAVRDLRIGRRRRNFEHGIRRINRRRAQGHARIEWADDEMHMIRDEFFRDRHALLRIAGIVTDFNAEFAAQNTAMGVDVMDGPLDAVADLRAEGGI